MEGGLGFREMKLFNWALLSKQSWRLVMGTCRLLDQIIKARYYPSSSFMEFELGSNLSYTCRGIREVKWVLRRGLRWRVGDGEYIRVWVDAWIPITRTQKILSPRGEFNVNLEVGAPINPISIRLGIKLLFLKCFHPLKLIVFDYFNEP